MNQELECVSLKCRKLQIYNVRCLEHNLDSRSIHDFSRVFSGFRQPTIVRTIQGTQYEISSKSVYVSVSEEKNNENRTPEFL